MNIPVKAIVSNSEMTKKYRECRDKAEQCGKIFIFKNNQPDAVLVSVAEYERLYVFIEFLESLEEVDLADIIQSLPKDVAKKIYSLNELKMKSKPNDWFDRDGCSERVKE